MKKYTYEWKTAADGNNKVRVGVVTHNPVVFVQFLTILKYPERVYNEF